MSTTYYEETSDKLAVRIRAHTEFTTIRIEEWLTDELRIGAGGRLLEVGCGDGNYFPTYSALIGESGLIVGTDMNRSLLLKAAERARDSVTPTLLLHWDFDVHPYPMLDGDFDVVIAPFSAYYTRDVAAWVDDSLRVLRSGGEMLLLGPTRENALELYHLNEAITGVRQIPETEETSQKIEGEFLPVLRERADVQVDQAQIQREIAFPTPEEYARYYVATWLYEKTLEKVGRPIPFDKIVDAASRTSLRVNKMVICVRARKK